MLLEHDLAVVHEGVLEGRRTVENVTKYVLMGIELELRQHVQHGGRRRCSCRSCRCCPIQVLLNNLLYDCSEAGVPLDRVDPEPLARPVRWDLPLIERFMLVLGPVSSLFDFLTFAALLYLFHADEALFQTGWFVESLATQVLVIFVIRTRGARWRSRPHPALAILSLAVVAIGVALPLTPLGALFGFVPPPATFYLFLVAAVAAYLALVEATKRLFYRRLAPGSADGVTSPGPARPVGRTANAQHG